MTSLNSLLDSGFSYSGGMIKFLLCTCLPLWNSKSASLFSKLCTLLLKFELSCLPPRSPSEISIYSLKTLLLGRQAPSFSQICKIWIPWLLHLKSRKILGKYLSKSRISISSFNAATSQESWDFLSKNAKQSWVIMICKYSRDIGPN